MQRPFAGFINDPNVMGGVLSRVREVEVLVKEKMDGTLLRRFPFVFIILFH
jgi:hypothetical protein